MFNPVQVLTYPRLPRQQRLHDLRKGLVVKKGGELGSVCALARTKVLSAGQVLNNVQF